MQVPDGTLLNLGSLEPRRGRCHAAVVFQPAGFEAGLGELDEEHALKLARSGLVVVAWDPRGRGESGGSEDADGFVGQDDLAAVLRVVAGLPGVDADAVGLRSRSMGGILAAGALARHEDLRPLGWVDYESPGWLRTDMYYASDHTSDRLALLAADSGDEEAWWAEREAAGFMPGVTVPYRRIQGYPDHALEWLGHAAAMLDEATASPAVYYNGEEVQPGELTLDDVRERAVDGGVEIGDAIVREQVLELFE